AKQEGQERLEYVRVVVDDKHSSVARNYSQLRCWPSRPSRRSSRCRQPDCRTSRLVRHALQAEFAAVALDDLLCETESKARSTVPLRGEERRKQPGKKLRRNPRSVIYDVDSN